MNLLNQRPFQVVTETASFEEIFTRRIKLDEKYKLEKILHKQFMKTKVKKLQNPLSQKNQGNNLNLPWTKTFDKIKLKIKELFTENNLKDSKY